MRVIIQRVSEASVTIDGKVTARIGRGFVILLGICEEDAEKDAQWLAGKISGMRIFSDTEGKMNLALADVSGELLVISQFTLFASTRKGNRPSFIKAARPEKAIPLYAYFIHRLQEESGILVKAGEFGSDMKIHLVNDGPVTIMLDSQALE